VWMDIDREHGRGLVHHPGHPLGWPGLPPEGLPPPAHLPPTSLLSSPSHTPQTLAGDPNGPPPPGNSGIPATTGPSTPRTGAAKDGVELEGSRPAPPGLATLQPGTAAPGAVILPLELTTSDTPPDPLQLPPPRPASPPTAARAPQPRPPSGRPGPRPAPGSGGHRTPRQSGPWTAPHGSPPAWRPPTSRPPATPTTRARQRGPALGDPHSLPHSAAWSDATSDTIQSWRRRPSSPRPNPGPNLELLTQVASSVLFGKPTAADPKIFMFSTETPQHEDDLIAHSKVFPGEWAGAGGGLPSLLLLISCLIKDPATHDRNLLSLNCTEEVRFIENPSNCWKTTPLWATA